MIAIGVHKLALISPTLVVLISVQQRRAGLRPTRRSNTVNSHSSFAESLFDTTFYNGCYQTIKMEVSPDCSLKLVETRKSPIPAEVSGNGRSMANDQGLPRFGLALGKLAAPYL